MYKHTGNPAPFPGLTIETDFLVLDTKVGKNGHTYVLGVFHDGKPEHTRFFSAIYIGSSPKMIFGYYQYTLEQAWKVYRERLEDPHPPYTLV